MNKLHPDHYADLKKSGLSDETIEQAGIRSIAPGQINKMIGFSIPDLSSAYQIPYGNGFSRIKAFYEKGKEFYADGKRKPRYLQKKDSGNRLYFPDKARAVLKDVSISLYLAEGEKKALKACQSGLPCIALSGLWSWKNKNEDKLITDFDLIVLKNREIFVIPDNDWQEPDRMGERKNLKDAVMELSYRLLDRGAKVFIVLLPQEAK
tara:strand:- start:169 stop:789 length:621 start_codon:yes stop_codon:yes gene_type:complete